MSETQTTDRRESVWNNRYIVAGGVIVAFAPRIASESGYISETRATHIYLMTIALIAYVIMVRQWDAR